MNAILDTYEKTRLEEERSIDQIIGKKTKSDGSSTSYYDLPPGARDVLDLIMHKRMNFSVANIFKACYRLGGKEGTDTSYDLRKIIFFAERELERISLER